MGTDWTRGERREWGRGEMIRTRRGAQGAAKGRGSPGRQGEGDGELKFRGARKSQLETPDQTRLGNMSQR